MRRLALSLMLIAALIAGGRSTPAAAQEVKEIAIAQQFGAIFIPLMAMENLQAHREAGSGARASATSR